MNSPFSAAAQGFSDIAMQLNSLRGGMSTLTYEGGGSAASQFAENLDTHLTTLSRLEENANTTADKANRQAEIDAELANAPTEEQIEELKQRWIDLKNKVASGEASEEELEQAQKDYLDAKKEREEALKKHAEDTEAHSIETDDEDTDTSGDASSGGAAAASGSGGGGGGLPSASSGGGGAPLAGDTELSSDTAAPMGPQAPMMSTPQQPQMPQMMQPQVQAPVSGVPMTAMTPQQQGFKSPKPVLPPRESDPYNLKGRKDPLSFLNRAAGPSTGVSGSTGGGITDTRGISVSGVTTKADVTGTGSTQLSGASGQATSDKGQQGTPMRGGMMGGMGGMMGGMGGAGGAGSRSKERPDIKTQDRDLLGKDSLDQAIEGGVIGRSTSTPTTGTDGGAR